MVRASDYYKYPPKTRILKRQKKSATIKNVPSYKLKKQSGLKFKDYVYLTVVLLIVAGVFGRMYTKASQLEPVQTAQAAVTATLAPSPNISFLSVPTPQPTPQVKYVERIDERVTALTEFLKKNDSPLAAYADLIVEQSDKYGIDWTLSVSIARKESSLCQFIKPGSHNCWGIGGASNFFYFSSWEEGIKYHIRLLGENYKWNANKAIQQKYCPDVECHSNWTDQVTATSNEILAMKK